jgi:hypothetical protein
MMLAIAVALALAAGLAIAALLRFVVIRRTVSKNAADWISGLVLLIVLVVGLTLKFELDPERPDNSGLYAIGLACIFAFMFAKQMLGPSKPPEP